MNKLIVALDVDFKKSANLILCLGDFVNFYKIGLNTFTEGYIKDYIRLLDGKKIFIDLKLYDIPNTVANAIRNIDDFGADITTVHACPSVIESAADTSRNVKIYTVSALTSLDIQQLTQMDINSTSVIEFAVKNIKMAKQYGADGVIAPGYMVEMIKRECGDNFGVIVPGIRFPDSEPDDQVQINTIENTISKGADHIVIGRPIYKSNDPVKKVIEIQKMIKNSSKSY